MLAGVRDYLQDGVGNVLVELATYSVAQMDSDSAQALSDRRNRRIHLNGHSRP